MDSLIPRRRFITISAAVAGLPLLPALPRWAADAEATPQLRIWRGVALGADAMLQINHPDPAVADRLIERSLAEVARLENIFSLYRADSAICRLNAAGALDDPPTDLVRILSESQEFSRATEGAFDVTVQPLWRLYAAHFSRDYTDREGPDAADIAAALALVGHDLVELDAGLIRLRRPGMGITLNGIAQGYVTDRVVELLLAAGLERALVDMGETRALGERPSGGPWTVGLEDPRRPGQVAETIGLRDSAVATSGGYGTQLDAAGRFNHIFDPLRGSTSYRYLSVSVVAPTATAADALSTAFCLMRLDEARAVADRFAVKAHFVLPDGSRLVHPA
jgi:thiamine biosynthesis lipoprotein